MSQAKIQRIDSRSLIFTAVAVFIGMFFAIAASIAIIVPIVQSQMSAYAAHNANTAALYTPANTSTYTHAAPATVSQNGTVTHCAEPETAKTQTASVNKALSYGMERKTPGTTINTTTTSYLNSNNTTTTHTTKTEIDVKVKDSFNENSYNKNSNNLGSSINSHNNSQNTTTVETNVASKNMALTDDHSVTTTNVNSHNQGSSLYSHNGDGDHSNNKTETTTAVETNINSKNDIEANYDSKNVQVGAFQNI